MKKYSVIRLSVCMVLTTNFCFGQSAINSVHTATNIVVAGGTSSSTIRSHASSVNTILPSTNYTVKYNNTGNVNVTDFALAGKTYVRFANFDTVIVRRAANAWETTGGNKQHIYVEGNTLVDNLTFSMPFPAAFPVVTNYAFMERVMEEGYINRGSDNVFNNDSTSDLTYNNIERVDFVYKNGIATTSISYAGFLIAERGGNDAFKIAAITGVDANGNPTSFGSVLSVGTGSYGNAIMNATTYVMRKDPADNLLRPFSLVPLQSIKSVFIKFSDLGIASMQKVYGYALMGNDVTATTSAQLLSYTNSTYYPRNTTTVNGGMDLAAAPGVFQTDYVLAGHYMTLSAQNRNCQQLLQWNNDDFSETKEYEIEKSLDGQHFTKLATVNTIQGAKSSFTDNSFSGSCYYRVKAVQQNGESFFSSVVFANSCSSASTVSLFPNPAKDMLTVNYDASMHINQVAIFSITGKEIGKWQVNQNNQQVKLDISALPQGHYVVRLVDANGVQKAYPVIKL